MDREDFVFRDPNGTRWRLIVRIARLAAAILTIGLATFFYALIVEPSLAPVPAGPPALLLADQASEAAVLPRFPAPWLTETAARLRGLIAPQPGGVRLGFLGDDRERGLASLRQHAPELTHVAAAWLRLTGMPPCFEETGDPEILSVADAAGLAFLPVVSNMVGESFDPEAVEHYLRAGVDEQQAFARDLATRLAAVRAQGAFVVWEQIDPVYRDEMTRLIGIVKSEFQAAHLELWISIPVGDDLKVFDLDGLAPNVDRFVAMLYYETGEHEEAGPLASLPWFREWLDALVEHGDRTQWIISLGAFGYDWPATGKPEVVSFEDAMARATSAGAQQIVNTAPHDGPTFSYRESGGLHRLWFLDAVSFRNQQWLVLKRKLGGVGVDRLGNEDPQVWQALRCGEACSPKTFESMVPDPNRIGLVGKGDFIRIAQDEVTGRRRISVDADGMWGVTYERFPRSVVVRRQGAERSDLVSLTFDDGPDPDWTPQILRILRAEGVKAAFFVTGNHASQHPELLRQIAAEGHEIGNHSFTHPDLSRTGELRTKLELNATQRAIEDLTGGSTLLFRPPYDADTAPHSLREVRPLILAQRLGYMPVMASIDPLDWQRPDAARILARVREARDGGNVVLLHDGGGDRSETIAALPSVIRYLRDRGDEIVPLHDLLGVPVTSVMPAIAPADRDSERLVAGTGIDLMQGLQRSLWGFLMLASGLLLVRTLLVVWLALRQARREAESALAMEPFEPSVSVVLAAHNEAAVIAETLAAILDGRYGGSLEVLVVDDGSTDDTAAVVSALATKEPRVRLLSQPNRGKAVALRHGLAQASHDFIVMLDADTRVEPNAIAELLRPLRDPKVGAVSTTIRVGNRETLLGRFQALEYLSAFNLDRRAFDALHAITVVPGAASAYRADAVRAAGGIKSDTLAEDTDLTLAMHRTGYRIRHTARTHATTEAPRTTAALLRQRKRWSFGTLQCIWKHRSLVLNPRFGWLGFFAIPGILFFQVTLAALAPMIDVWLILSLFQGVGGPALGYALIFLGSDLILALVACRLDGSPLRAALLVIPMRLLYRPLISVAILSSLLRAMRGRWIAWGRQERWGLRGQWGQGRGA